MNPLNCIVIITTYPTEEEATALAKLLIEKKQRGLFNMVCGGYTGRLEVAHELVKLLGLEGCLEVEEVTSEFFADEYFAERPKCERLLNKRLDDLSLNIMRDWRIALKEYLVDFLNFVLNTVH